MKVETLKRNLGRFRDFVFGIIITLFILNISSDSFVESLTRLWERNRPESYSDLAPVSVIKSVNSSYDKGDTYIVKKDETMYGISKKTGVSVSDLKKFNNIDGTLIKPGQSLKLK